MAGGLQVGSLYASLSASTSAWNKALEGALKTAEKFAKDMKRVSSEIASAGAAMTAVGAAAVAMAQAVDGPTKKAMDGLHKSTQLLAVQVADMLLPAIRALSDMMKTAAGVVAGLSPHTKEMITTFAVIAVQVAAAAKAFSVFSGLAGTVIGLARALLAVAAPLAGIAVAVGAVVAVVILLHRAWRKNWGGIQEATQSVLEWLRSGFTQLADFMGGVWNFMVDGAARFVDGLLSVGEAIERITGKKLGIAGMREGFAGLWKDLKSGSFFSGAFEFGKSLGAQIGTAASEELSLIMSELGIDKLLAQGKTIGLGRGMHSPDAPTNEAGRGSERTGRGGAAFGVEVGNVNTSAAPANAFMREMAMMADQASAANDRIAKTYARAAAHAATMENAAKRAAEHARKHAEVVATLKNIGNTLVQNTGALGRAISNIASAAQQGGPWAALIAAVMEIFQRMESFQRLLRIFEQMFVRLGEMLAPLLDGIFKLIGDAVAWSIEGLKPLFDALQPLFDALLPLLTKMLSGIGQTNALFSGLAPVIEVFATVIGAVFDALKPLMDILGMPMKLAISGILLFVKSLNDIAAAFGDTKAAEESKRLGAIIDKLWAPDVDARNAADAAAAGATWELAAGAQSAATAIEKASASLSNVPSGYKMALSRFNADMGITGTPFVGGGGGGTTINGNVYVTSSSSTIGGVAEDAKKEAARERGQQRGTGAPPRGRGGRD